MRHWFVTLRLLLVATTAQANPYIHGVFSPTPPQAATPSCTPGTGSYASSQSVTCSDATSGATIYYTTNGTTPTTSSPIYSGAISITTTTTLQAIATASGYSQSVVVSYTYTISGTTNSTLYPQIAISGSNNGAHFPTTDLQQLAQYQVIIMGGNYPGWPGANSSNGGYGTRDQVVQGIKSYNNGSNKNASTTKIFQYEDINEMPYSSSSAWWIEWWIAVNCNNWWLYASGSSGTKTNSAYASSYGLMIPQHGVGKDSSSCNNTNLYPMQLMAYLLYQRYYTGSSSAGSAMAAPHADGYFIDNQTVRNLQASNGDWLRTGSGQSNTDPTSIAANTTGKADYCSELAALNSTLLCGSNTDFAYSITSTSVGGLGISSSNAHNTGVYAYGWQQYMFGTPSGSSCPGSCPNPVTYWTGTNFGAVMTWYETLESSLATNGTPVLTGYVAPTDYVDMRYGLGLILLRNGVMHVSTTCCDDSMDPSNPSAYPVFDEFWGGTKVLAGFMGTSGTGARGAEQSAAWSNGVYERNYQYCAVFLNPVGNGTQTINPTTLGYTNLYYLHGSQDSTHNPGGSTPVTSFSLAAGDSQILCNSPSP